MKYSFEVTTDTKDNNGFARYQRSQSEFDTAADALLMMTQFMRNAWDAGIVIRAGLLLIPSGRGGDNR